jgi:hypothetical protein
MKSPLHSNTHLYRRATMYQEDLTVEIFRERPTSSNRLNNNNSSSNNRGLSAVRERWHRGIHRTRRTLSPHRRPRTLPPLPKISTWGYSALTACPLPQPSCQVCVSYHLLKLNFTENHSFNYLTWWVCDFFTVWFFMTCIRFREYR